MAETLKEWHPKLICSIALPTSLTTNYIVHYYKGNVTPINSKTPSLGHYDIWLNLQTKGLTIELIRAQWLFLNKWYARTH